VEKRCFLTLIFVLIFSGVFVSLLGPLVAQEYINPHIRMDGTYVPGHDPNRENYYFGGETLTKSINPFTGQLDYTRTLPAYPTDHDLNYTLGQTYNMQFNYNYFPGRY